MSKNENQKLKMLYLIDYLKLNTDSENGVTVTDIIDYLALNDIKAERKSVYSDIDNLVLYGYDIIKVKRDKKMFYHLVSREFEVAELKLLVDAIQFSKFISYDKTNELIKKIEQLTSKYDAINLQRHVKVFNRVKTSYDHTINNVDYLHTALRDNKTVEFSYMKWNYKKELVERQTNKRYLVTPFSLAWFDENYYMIAYEHISKKIKHYRVDKMAKIKISDEPQEGLDISEKFDTVDYTKRIFGMYGGANATVKLLLDESLIGVVIDRFGQDILIIPTDKKSKYTANVDVALSNQFIGWLVGLGDRVKVVEPVIVTKMIADYLDNIRKFY